MRNCNDEYIRRLESAEMTSVQRNAIQPLVDEYKRVQDSRVMHALINSVAIYKIDVSKSRINTECDVLEWLAANDFAIIGDSQIEIFRNGPVDVLLDDGEFTVRVHTADKARLIRFEMRFSQGTPAATITNAIATHIASHTDER